MPQSPANRPPVGENRADAADRCNVAVLGATGSIGTATLDVLRHLRQTDSECDWRLWAASGHKNLEKLQQIATQTAPIAERLIFSDADAADGRKSSSGQKSPEVSCGPDALVRAASDPEVDVVVAAIVGRAGLESTMAAIDAGKRVALANKETLVVAGSLAWERRLRSQAEILPVDSEHSAIFQCIASHPSAVKRLILTASGGPFAKRRWTKCGRRVRRMRLPIRPGTWGEKSRSIRRR